MVDIAPSTSIAAQITALAPLAAAALASNMAYLNLARFRYREQMRKCAAEQLVPIGSPQPTAVTDMDQYRGLLYLASLKNHDGLDKKQVVPLNIPVKCPPGAWSGTYSWLFAHHQDIFLGAAFSAIAALAIFLGVALSIGMWAFALPYLDGCAPTFFWFLTVTTIAPGVFIWAGRWVVHRGCEYAIDAATQLAGVIDRLAQVAANPNLPPVAIQVAGPPRAPK